MVLYVNQIFFQVFLKPQNSWGISFTLPCSHKGPVQVFPGNNFVKKMIIAFWHCIPYIVWMAPRSRSLLAAPTCLSFPSRPKQPERGIAAPNKMHWTYPRKDTPSGCMACQTGPDVRVRIRRHIVQVQIEQPGLGAVAPVPAALSSYPLFDFFQPTAHHFPDFVYMPYPNFIPFDRDVFQPVRFSDQSPQIFNFYIQIL
jgi:hypothetical protein